jgi:hypothetical protein
MKKFLHFLQLRDGIWSVPLTIAAFWLIGVIIQAVFGYGAGSYDPAFIQPLLLAATVVIFATNLANVGLWFNFRGIHRYLYGYKDENGQWINPSKEDWKQLAPLHRLLLTLFVLFAFMVLVVIVYSILV